MPQLIVSDCALLQLRSSSVLIMVLKSRSLNSRIFWCGKVYFSDPNILFPVTGWKKIYFHLTLSLKALRVTCEADRTRVLKVPKCLQRYIDITSGKGL
jgi:hypothetical protein